MSIHKKIIGALLFMVTFRASAYIITVKNESKQDIFFSFTTRLDRCGTGEIFPDPKETDFNKKLSIAPDQEHIVNIGKSYGPSCEKWCFTGIKIFERSIIALSVKKSRKVITSNPLHQVAHLDLATGFNAITGKCSDITVQVNDDLKNTPTHSKWRVFVNQK